MDMMKSTMTTPHATPPMCSAMVLRSNCIASSWTSFFWLPGRALGELEVDGHRHDDGYRYAVQERRRVDPLPHGVGRRLVEQRDAAQHLHVRDLALRRDRALEDHDALHARLLGDVGVDGRHVLELLGLLDLPAHADGLHGRRRRVGQTAHDAAHDTAGHAALDT